MFSKSLNKSAFKRLWYRIFGRAEKYSTASEFALRVKKILGFPPQNTDWYRKAFTHPGYNLRDEKGNLYNFERLEFLGDSVLSLVTAEYLFRKYPGKKEGQLTDIRSKMVSRKTLNRIGQKWQLRKFLPPAGRHRYGHDLEGNVLEALVGAVFMDQGYDRARQFILNKILPQVKVDRLENHISSYKAEIIDWCQKHRKNYRFDTQTEPTRDGRLLFHVRLFVDDKPAGRGRAFSKKKAEETAARNAYRHLVEGR